MTLFFCSLDGGPTGGGPTGPTGGERRRELGAGVWEERGPTGGGGPDDG